LRVDRVGGAPAGTAAGSKPPDVGMGGLLSWMSWSVRIRAPAGGGKTAAAAAAAAAPEKRLMAVRRDAFGFLTVSCLQHGCLAALIVLQAGAEAAGGKLHCVFGCSLSVVLKF
jgi:hypothetical protein